jgi:acyl-CoA reductase-like NAD-dependent aldehyde dehydrogenase
MLFQAVNPATGELVQTFKEISDDDLDLALATAQKAYETDWRLRPVAERAKIVSRAATILREKADESAGYLTLEMGKGIAASHGEVDRRIPASAQRIRSRETMDPRKQTFGLLNQGCLTRERGAVRPGD